MSIAFVHSSANRSVRSGMGCHSLPVTWRSLWSAPGRSDAGSIPFGPAGAKHGATERHVRVTITSNG
jgi:hypothetical protein